MSTETGLATAYGLFCGAFGYLVGYLRAQAILLGQLKEFRKHLHDLSKHREEQ